MKTACLCRVACLSDMFASGDQRPGVTPADIVFMVEEKPHARFKREGNDLLYTHRLPLVEALCGPSFRVQTLDGRSLPVTVQSSVGPNSVKVSTFLDCHNGVLCRPVDLRGGYIT